MAGGHIKLYSQAFNSPLSKIVADWGEDGHAFNYGIVWGHNFSLTQEHFN